jgi:hypothetical protein
LNSVDEICKNHKSMGRKGTWTHHTMQI